MLGTCLFALQKAFDVGGNLLALPGEVLTLDIFLRGRNRIPSRTLGDVHAGIGHADDVFDGETVHRETGNAEAARNVVFSKHGVAGQPLAQAFGQNLGLFGAGLRHQNDELIATVARNHVRLPGFLFEQTAYAGQHQIALKVAHGVVDLFKFVEIDEHDGERAAGTRSSFPLRRQSFPEKAAGFDSSQAVGDGLLLQLLEHESIVQRSRQQVGQRIEDQNILRGKCILVAALDVEYAEQRFAVGNRDAKDGARIRKNSRQIAGQSMLNQGAFAGASDAAENARSQRDAFAHGMSRRTGFRLNLDLFGSVVEQADADVIEAEVLLNLCNDLTQHVHGIVAGNCGAGDVIEESKLARTALLVGKETGVFHGDRYLPRRRRQYIEIALLENEFPVGIHRDHDSRGLVAHKNRHRDQALGGAARNMADAQTLPGSFQVRADQQGV